MRYPAVETDWPGHLIELLEQQLVNWMDWMTLLKLHITDLLTGWPTGILEMLGCKHLKEKVANMELDMVAHMEVDKVADIEVDMVCIF